MQVVDYSFARPGAAAIRAAGFAGAIRYLSPPPNEKNLDAAERDELLGTGLAVGLVWETTTSRATQGFAAGQSDATQANELADALGAPSLTAIYYAVDSPNYGPADVADYFQGVLSVGHRPAGVYGSQAVCEAMLDLGCHYAWQVDTWGDGVSPRAHLAQLGNGHPSIPGTDLNDVLADDWGAWVPTTAPAPPDDVPGLEHLHPTFAARVANACRSRGTSVYSGARSTEDQARLYQEYLAGRGNPANPPGTSWHEYGTDLLGGPYAVAVDFDQPYPHGEPGLVFPIPGEPWHCQPQEVGETARVAGAEDRIPDIAPPEEEDMPAAPNHLLFNYRDAIWLRTADGAMGALNNMEQVAALQKAGVPTLGDISAELFAQLGGQVK